MPIDFACTSPSDWAVNALNARANAIANPKDSLWSRTGPWARVLSSANIMKNGNLDSSLRNEYALWSGNLDTFENSYVATEIGGVIKTFKPKFGLESIKVSYKGTMGSTKSCVVNFKVWSLEDLEVVEKLYMVPGISVIVEWGWPISSDGTPVQPASNFINYGPRENPYSDIMSTIIDRRKLYQGDYDGLVGVVTNFNYALNEQLGFDCSFELCAPGELWLEQSVSNVSKNCIGADNTSIKKQTNLEHIFDEYYRKNQPAGAVNTTFKKQTSDYPSIKNPLVISQVWETFTSEYDKARRSGFFDKLVGAFSDKIEETFGPRDHNLVYINWNLFVKLLNENINQYILDANGLPTDGSKKSPDIALAMDIIPVTILPKMYPLDPRTCTFEPINPDYAAGVARRNELVQGFFNWVSVNTDQDAAKNRIFTPNQLKKLNSTPEILGLNETEITSLGTKLDASNCVSLKNELTNDTTGLVGLLNNIYLNTEWLRDISQLTAGEQVTADDYLKKILDGLNAASGNLWNLQYIVDERDNNLLHIYDANYTSVASRNQTIQPYEFKFKKDASPLIHNMRVESKLVDGFKSMVLYGNSTDTGGSDTTHQAMSLYSNKVVDGFKIQQDIKTDSNEESTVKGNSTTCVNSDGEIVEQKVESNPEADLDMAYAELIDALTDDSVAATTSAMASYIAHVNTAKPEVASKLPMNQNILLPFNCSFDIDGFSGFSWGNTVKVDYLPSRYFKTEGTTSTSRIYFQITKIEHEITTTDWITTVETIMRLTPEYKKTDTKDYSKAKYSYDPAKDAAEQKAKFAAADSTGNNPDVAAMKQRVATNIALSSGKVVIQPDGTAAQFNADGSITSLGTVVSTRGDYAALSNGSVIKRDTTSKEGWVVVTKPKSVPTKNIKSTTTTTTTNKPISKPTGTNRPAVPIDNPFGPITLGRDG